MSEANRCPACQARFRATAICSRCGADLSRLMQLSVEVWRLRQSARTALAAGDFDLSFNQAAKAQEIQFTPAGDALLKIAKWLAEPPCTPQKGS